MELASTIIATIALGFSVIAFIITFTRGKKLEEIKMTHEILKNFYENENNILDVDRDEDIDQWTLRHLQYLNMWEWFAFLVNHGQLKNDDIKDYFRPMLIRDHDTVLTQPEFEAQRNNPQDYKEFKELYTKWAN